MSEIDAKNRKNDEEKFTAKKDAIDYRRKQVYIMDQQGFSNNEIAEKLQVSVSTVEKDLHEIKYQALSWYGELASAGKYKLQIDCIENMELVQKELWTMYRKEQDSSKKLKILAQITQNTKSRNDVTGYIPGRFIIPEDALSHLNS